MRKSEAFTCVTLKVECMYSRMPRIESRTLRLGRHSSLYKVIHKLIVNNYRSLLHSPLSYSPLNREQKCRNDDEKRDHKLAVVCGEDFILNMNY